MTTQKNTAINNDFSVQILHLYNLLKLQHTHIRFWDDVCHCSGHHNRYNLRHRTNIYMSSFTELLKNSVQKATGFLNRSTKVATHCAF